MPKLSRTRAMEIGTEEFPVRKPIGDWTCQADGSEWK